MLTLLIAGPLIAVLVVWLAPKLLPRRVFIALGIAIAALGAIAVAYVEWQYAPERTLLVQMPVALDRAATIASAPFAPHISGPYDIWLEFDRKQEGEDFACLTGDPGAEGVCPRRDPDLDLAWSVDEDGAPAARGATDWRDWHARQAALDPAEAARRRKAFEAYQAKSLDPSNNWPRYFKLGSFTGTAARQYRIALDIHKPAGALAALHPRLAIGLGAAATKGLGSLALVFCLICIVTGAMLLLRAIPRGSKGAPP
ncbi:MAG TPA: hypothetical protein VHZ78_02445 [Rhizomicrobium sp.]|jgi:hypothetical protein|nr:hypothetical protein [Rhizomicrobium sp.]